MIDPILQSGATYQLAQKLLDGAALRQEAIAANLANSETPGYHRVDLAPNFAARLKASWEAATAGGVADPSEVVQPTLAPDADARSTRPDGNNVQIEQELMAMNRNSVEYEYLTDVVSNNIKQLRIAISGQVG